MSVISIVCLVVYREAAAVSAISARRLPDFLRRSGTDIAARRRCVVAYEGRLSQRLRILVDPPDLER